MMAHAFRKFLICFFFSAFISTQILFAANSETLDAASAPLPSVSVQNTQSSSVVTYMPPQVATQNATHFMMEQKPLSLATPIKLKKLTLSDGTTFEMDYVGNSDEIAQVKVYKDGINIATVNRKSPGEYRMIDHRNGLVYESMSFENIESLAEIVKASPQFSEEYKKYYMRIMVYVSANYRISLAEAHQRIEWKVLSQINSAEDLNFNNERIFVFRFLQANGKNENFEVYRKANGDFYGADGGGKQIDLKNPIHVDLGGGASEDHYFDENGSYIAFAKIQPNGNRKVYDAVSRRLLAETVSGKLVIYVGYAGKGFYRLQDALQFAKDGDVIQIASGVKWIKGGFTTSKKITIKGGKCQQINSGDPLLYAWSCGV